MKNIKKSIILLGTALCILTGCKATEEMKENSDETNMTDKNPEMTNEYHSTYSSIITEETSSENKSIEEVYKRVFIPLDSSGRKFYAEDDENNMVLVSTSDLSRDGVTLYIDNLSEYDFTYVPYCKIIYVCEDGSLKELPIDRLNVDTVFNERLTIAAGEKKEVRFETAGYDNVGFGDGTYMYRISDVRFISPAGELQSFDMDIFFYPEEEYSDPLENKKMFRFSDTEELFFCSEIDPDKDKYKISVKAQEVSAGVVGVILENLTDLDFYYGKSCVIYRVRENGVFTVIEPTGSSRPYIITSVANKLKPGEKASATFRAGFFRMMDFDAGNYIFRIKGVGFHDFENTSASGQPEVMINKRQDYLFDIDIPFIVEDVD